MTTTTQTPVDALMRQQFEAWMDSDAPPYWRTTAHAREAWRIWQASARALAAIPAQADLASRIYAIAGFLVMSVNAQQDHPEEPPQYATEFDMHLERAGHELSQIARALESPTAVQPLSDGDFAFLDDDGKQMMSTSHHYTVKDIKALIDDLKAVEQGVEQPEWVNRDHRTRCGVIWRVMAALASDVPVAPLPEAERQDSARLDAMQLHRISVVPEYEGPWDAEVYGDEGEPEAVGTGSTPREAIDNAIAAHGIVTKESST